MLAAKNGHTEVLALLLPSIIEQNLATQQVASTTDSSQLNGARALASIWLIESFIKVTDSSEMPACPPPPSISSLGAVRRSPRCCPGGQGRGSQSAAGAGRRPLVLRAGLRGRCGGRQQHLRGCDHRGWRATAPTVYEYALHRHELMCFNQKYMLCLFFFGRVGEAKIHVVDTPPPFPPDSGRLCS
jgi:hypothetical protein